MNNDNKPKFFFLLISFAIFLLLPPFLLGGVYSHIGTNLIIIFVCSFFTFVYAAYLLILKKPLAVSAVIFPFLAIILFALFQLIPLPLSILKILSPQTHFFHLIEGAGARPLTNSVTDTIYSIFRIITLIFFSFIIARNIFVGNKRWKQITIDAIIFISTVVILVSIVLQLLQSGKWLYGSFKHSGFLLESILINSNHAAGFFGISGILALTSIYSSEFSRKKIFYASLFFLHSLAVIATLSRGGIIAYVFALLFFLITNKKSFKQIEGSKFYFAIAAIALSLFLAYYTGAKMLEYEFDFGREGYFDKIKILSTAKEYFGDYFLTGSGLGSFSKVFTYYQKNPESFFSEMENEPIQFALETGLFFALFIFVLFLWLIASCHRETKRKTGLIAALFFIVLQNTFDYNLHNFSTLFPTVAILVLLLKPIPLHGKKRTAAICSVMAVSLFTMIFISTKKGQSLMGYSDSYPYETAVYYYPASYKIPLEKAIERLNSRDPAVSASAGIYTSAVVSKAPKYYFTHYLNGFYLAGLGSFDQALLFFKQSLALSGTKYSFILPKIYEKLEWANQEKRIVEILEITKENRKELERFVFNVSKRNEAVLKFAYENQESFFISIIRDLIDKKEYLKAEELIDKISNENKALTKEERGRLLIYRGKILEADKFYKDAFSLYMQGAAATGEFYDYLTAAHCSLRLDLSAQTQVEKKLKNLTLKAAGNLEYYYKWLSQKEFFSHNYADGFKYLERAADISKRPYRRYELANLYSRREMYYFSSQNFLKIMRDFPEFRPDEIKKRYEEEKAKMETQEAEKMKEFLLKSK